MIKELPELIAKSQTINYIGKIENVTGMAMEERFSLSCWQKGPLAQPVLKGSLASLEGESAIWS